MGACPECGTGITTQLFGTMPAPTPFGMPGVATWKPTVSGILIMVGAMFCLITGLLLIIILAALGRFSYYDYYDFYNIEELLIVLIIFEFWSFSLGLAGSIFILKRQKFVIAMLGAVFVLIGGCLAFFVSLLIGIIVLPLAIIGLVFLILSKPEFDVPGGARPGPMPHQMAAMSPFQFPQPIVPRRTTQTIPTKLRELKSLHEDGLITKDEFEEKRKELVSKL